MKADITRATFRSTKRFHNVVMQQGRVQLDADWNESVDILSGLDETTRIDTIGPRGVPNAGGGFEITLAPDATDLLIGAGRIYVEGLLCEIGAERAEVTDLQPAQLGLAWLVLDDEPLQPADWIVVEDATGVIAAQLTRIAAIDEEARTVTVAPALTDTTMADATVRRAASYASQRDLPDPEHVTDPAGNAPPVLALDDGTYLAYLDVWLRHLTYLDDSSLQDPALGGLDTATRLRTMAQVQLKYLGATLISDCEQIPPLPDLFEGSTESGDRPPSTGRLAARARPAEETDELCEIPADARYQGMENQLYRVEVHDPGALGSATFKWSRENATIAALWTDQDGDRLTVSSTGRDADLGFASGQLVELIDDTLELRGRPGTLVELSAPPIAGELTIAPTPPVDIADFPRNAKVRRWDNPSLVTVEAPTGDGFIALENGVEVRFEPGQYNTGDYWLIPARTATRDVEWPRDDRDRPQACPPDGIAHHYAPLALVEVAGGVATTTHDCRDPFPSLTTITAGDVAFDNDECEIPGAHTVQDALDALCESSTLRRHNKHLHGWGIVCGLRVSCGPDDEGTPRSRVTVSDGYALDCEGNDLVVDEDTRLDVFRLMKRHSLDDLLDVDQADVSLFMTSDVERGIVYGVEPYDPDWDKRRNPLAGDFLNDVYEECIEPIHAFLKEQLGIDEERGVHKARVAERQSILASLMAQVVNPNASQTIYLSIREHEIAKRFYDDLRALLESETFCAMFDDAAPFPDYPDLPEMDTIFGIGHHQRIRIRPGGREAWTVGGGLNPVNPTTFVNRFDLEKRVLLERLAPFAGTAVDENEPDTGTGIITDVAFSPDGDRVYVVAPTKNGQNTLFRAGRIGDRAVQWGELVTICDTKLLTLATTHADPGHVYAVGSMTGLYKIDPDAVDPSMAPIQAFPSSGHLVMTADGRGYATAVAQGTTGTVPTYNRLIGFTFGAPTTAFIDVALPAAGSDGLAVASTVGPRSGNQIESVYVTTGTGTGSRTLLAYDGRSGAQRTGVAIDLAGSPLTLQPFETTGVLMVVSEDDCLVELVDLARQELLPRPLIPVQVGPVAAGSSEKLECAYVLNYWSDTITVIPAAVLRRGAEWPLQRLADYRRDIIHAFRDLLAGFLQYLKDCLCDHLMVNCPVCDGDEKIYLATVNIRDRQIYKVCNFSRRKYVKSFPTVDYWLSIVPIMPMIQKAVEEFCCAVLPDMFGRPTVPEYEEDAPRRAPAVRYSVARENVDTARNIDISAKIKDVQTRTTVAARTLGRAGRRTLLETMTEPAMRTANLVDRPIDDVTGRLTERGVRVVRGADEPEDLGSLLGNLFGLLRTPQPGDEVTLHEDGGRVSYMSVARPSARRLTGEIPADVEELARAVEARDAEVAALRTEVERLQTSQASAQARVDDARVTALETELKELRGLRDQVTSLLASRPATARQPSGGSTKTQPKTSGPAKAKPTSRRTSPKPGTGKG